MMKVIPLEEGSDPAPTEQLCLHHSLCTWLSPAWPAAALGLKELEDDSAVYPNGRPLGRQGYSIQCLCPLSVLACFPSPLADEAGDGSTHSAST